MKILYHISFLSAEKLKNTIKHTLHSWQGDDASFSPFTIHYTRVKWEMLSLLNINVKLMIIKLIIKKLYYVVLNLPFDSFTIATRYKARGSAHHQQHKT